MEGIDYLILSVMVTALFLGAVNIYNLYEEQKNNEAIAKAIGMSINDSTTKMQFYHLVNEKCNFERSCTNFVLDYFKETIIVMKE